MKSKLLFFILINLGISQLHAQDADQILSEYLDKTGGLNAWKELHSMTIKASFEQNGMAFNTVIYRKQPNLSRTEIEVQGNQVIQAYDGETGWMINPMTGTSEPQKMPEEMTEVMKEEKFESDLIDYKKKGNTVELIGTEAVNGVETFKIRLTKANGEEEFYFFDKGSHLPVMERRLIKIGPMKDQDSETFIGDYREVGDLLMPHLIEVKANGQLVQKLKIDEYVFNEDLDDTIFKFPEDQ
jgi:outer membrane lipoprotein-sorting protein